MVDILTHKLDGSGVPFVRVTPAEEKVVRDPMAFLVIKSPFFAHVMYQECTITYSDIVDIAATDGKHLIFNPWTIQKLKLSISEIAFIVCHEVLHVMLGDLYSMAKWRKDGYVIIDAKGTKLPYVHKLMNAAQDFRINAMLIEAKIGTMPKIGLYDKNISEKGMETSVEIYAKLYKERGKHYDPGGGFDELLQPTQQAIDTIKSGRMDQVIAAAGAAAQAIGQGSIPAAIKQLLGEILEPKVAWQDHLRATITRAAGDPAYDWTTIDRRLLVRPTPIFFAKPGFQGCGTVVVGYDTSGSCVSPAMQQVFFSEMAGIVRDLNPARLIVLWCDAKVQRTDELEDPDDLEELRLEINALGGAPGGGGTSFRPVFEELEHMDIEPELLVYLTDGHGTFPQRDPGYPVIWAVTKGGNYRIPFGDLVEVEL